MPEYHVRDPRSNRTVVLRGDSPPTEQELHQIFARLNAEAAPPPAAATEGMLPPSRVGGESAAVTQAGAMSTPSLSLGEQALGVPRGVWNVLNPVSAVKAGAQAITHPVDTAKAMLSAQGALGQEAGDAFQSGDYLTATRKGINWLLPVIGPGIDAATEKVMGGQVGEGVGEAIGIGLGMGTPSRMMGGRVNIPSQSRLNPRQSAAVQFGEQHGIPVDAATATDSRFVRAAQRRVSDTIGGAGTAERFRGAQEDALTRVGGELAERANASRTGRPGAPQDRVSAGEAVQQRLESRINAQARVADRAYDELRALEQAQAQRIAQTGGIQAPPGARHPSGAGMPFTDVPLAVDVSAAKAALRPIYDDLLRESKLGIPMQGGKGRALSALDGLMNGPDLAPISAVDAALGDLKTMARTADLPALRTQGQATAAAAVRHLEEQVMAAARRGGRPVVDALMRGRRATIGKYETAAVREQLSGEPARVVDDLTRGRDVNLERLRAVAQQAPREVPKIARAYLDDLLAKATAEGGFGRAQGLWADWQRLGPETKAVLFPDRGLRRDLDNFFLLAKKSAENPNPSGTASVLTVTNIGLSVPAWAIAKLLYSRRGVQVLTRGLSIPVGNKAASAAWQAEVANLIGRDAGAPAALPAAAEDRTPTEPEPGR